MPFPLIQLPRKSNSVMQCDKMKMKQKKDSDDDEDDGDVIYFKPGTGGLRHHMDDVDGNDPHDVHTTYF